MDKPKWKTIDAGKLEVEIQKLSTEIDALMQTARRTDDIGLAVKIHGLTATHNALMAVFNSLD